VGTESKIIQGLKSIISFRKGSFLLVRNGRRTVIVEKSILGMVKYDTCEAARVSCADLFITGEGQRTKDDKRYSAKTGNDSSKLPSSTTVSL
jgi:hypothetical protein